MPGDLADLCFEFHYGCDLADADVLAQLQTALGRLAPRMSATLEVHAYERDRTRRHVDVADPDALRAAVVAKGTERGPTFQALTRNRGASGGDRTYPTWGGGVQTGAGGAVSGNTGSAGSGETHFNIQPTCYVNVMIKL